MKQIIQEKLERLLKSKDFMFSFSSGLSEREKVILSMSAEGKTHKEIGEKFGVTRQRVGQLERRARQKIKEIKRISFLIADVLTKEMEGIVFTDEEVENAFVNHFKATTEKSLPQVKMMWHDFSRMLWSNKNEDN